MKNIDVEINNFGKIKQAKFQVKPFTVIAGKNASGKSFITRGLYSFFSTLNKDHLSIELSDAVFNIQRIIIPTVNAYIEQQSEDIKTLWTKLQSTFDDLTKKINLFCGQNTFAMQLASTYIIKADIKQLRHSYQALNKCNFPVIELGATGNAWMSLNTTISLLETFVKKTGSIFGAKLNAQLEQSLFVNFQVNALRKLCNNGTAVEEEFSFNFGGTGQCRFKSDKMHSEFNVQGVDAFQSLDNVVYLESPMYWKIKDALKGWVTSRNDPSLRRQVKHQQKALKKIPQYILDTFELLDTDIIQDKSYPQLIKLKQTIEQCIGGNIHLSDSGDLQFNQQNEQGGSYSVDLNQMATGATSLGIIALLLDKNIIVPNSVLIFDEPEVNLHPAWQQVMIQVLYQLSVAGVTIIMASHSFDMMQCIEKLMDVHEHDDKEVNDHFSIVQLDNGSTINHDKPIYKKLDAVKADLGMPLFDLFSKL